MNDYAKFLAGKSQIGTDSGFKALWMPDDVVLTPFMGVGSEVYGAVANGRRGVGVELKKSYYRQAVKNVAMAGKEAEQSEMAMFASAVAEEEVEEAEAA